MSDREFVVSTRFYLNSFDFTQFNLNMPLLQGYVILSFQT